MRTMVLLLLLARACAGVAAADLSSEPGLNTYEETSVRAKDNAFGVYIPASYDAKTPMPLVVNAHEIKSIAEWQKFADEMGFIVVGAMCISNRGGSFDVFHSELLDDEKHLLRILQRVFDSLTIDRKNVLFTGCSAGAFPTWFVAAKHPEVFTALCFRSGNFPGELENINDYMPRWKTAPVFMYWGENDRPHVYKQNVEAVKFLEEKIKLENFKREIIPGGGHTSRADICSKWFQSIFRKTVPPLPEKARLALNEDWALGKLDAAKWYMPRKKWGNGNNGVAPENVFIAREKVGEREQDVLVCEAHGDLYDGAIAGFGGAKTRVGGAIVSKEFFASGRFEIVMKIGDAKAHDGGPADPRLPKGSIPALWTYGYRYVEVAKERMKDFVPETPLYNPHMPRYGSSVNEYSSEIDFPELGKGGDFSHGLYNTYLQTREECQPFEVGSAADGQYHTFVTEWRTKLEPITGVTDAQVVEHLGFWWIKDKAIPFASYDGNPLKRLGPDQYALYRGDKAEHWIDGKKIGKNQKCVPAMAAQLNIGVWLPDWAGPAAWKTARVSIASVKVWRFDDPGDVHGVIIDSLKDNFDKAGNGLK